MAKVQMTGFHPAARVYSGPHEGIRVCASVENVGLVLRAQVDLEREVTREECPFDFRTTYGLCHRYIWDSVERKPLRDDLLSIKGDNMTIGPIWGGPANIEFFDAEAEDVLQFQPRRMVGGWFWTMRFDHSDTPPSIVYSYV
jgi:hypothetical protein